MKLHQLTHSASATESSFCSVLFAPARAPRIFKGKHPNPSPHFLISRPQGSRLNAHHQQHSNAKNFLLQNLPFFHQCTYYSTGDYNQQNLYVYENVLFPTLFWTTYYHFTNPLGLPLNNTPEDNELCHSFLHKLTTALHETVQHHRIKPDSQSIYRTTSQPIFNQSLRPCINPIYGKHPK